ncbi:MAG: hypothetical protein U0797_26665 [Gemmataceae bacterium]
MGRLTCCSRRTSRSFSPSGYPWLIHRLTYRRTSHKNLHVRVAYKEGTTTAFDMVVLNDLDRFHLVEDVIDGCRSWAPGGVLQTGDPRKAD